MPNYQMLNTMARIFKQSASCLTQKQIIEYVQRVVSPEERFLIEHHLSDCDVCFEAVEGMEKLGPQADVRTPTDRIARQLDERFFKKRRAYLKSRWNYYYSIAAAVLIGVGSAWVYVSQNPYRTLIAEYCKPYPNTIPLVRDARAASPLENAMMEYELENYGSSAKQLEQILAAEPGNLRAHFYAGMSYLMTDQTQKAITEFTSVSGSKSAELSTEAFWYLAWAYLKNKDILQAKILFDQMAAGQNEFSEQAKIVLKQLN